MINIGNIEVYKNDIILERNNIYAIKNINIGGIQYSFRLNPKDENAITDVMEWLWVTYKLDNIAPDEDARDSVKVLEDYNNFFVNLLIESRENEIVIFDDSGKIEDSVEINIFKTDQLFGANGDFSIMKGIIGATFDNTQVEVDGGKYTTTLENIIMLPTDIVKKTDRGETVQWRIWTQYNVDSQPRNFTKIKLEFDLVRSNGTDVRKDFWWAVLYVTWAVTIDSFTEFYTNLWTDYVALSNFYNTKEKLFWESSISRLVYSAKSREALISFQHKWALMTVTFREWEVLEIKYRDDSFKDAELNNIENLLKSFL